jgi:glucose/arabinose dehydrogenase
LLATASATGPSGAAVGLAVLDSHLASPVAIAHAGDGSGRLFIVEQAGRIRVWTGASVLAAPFLDVSAKVATGGERGLLAVAFDPAYETPGNGHFYVYYTGNGSGGEALGDLVLERYQVSAGDANVANPGSVARLLTIPHATFANHNGGQLAFGADRHLYVSTGDGGGGGDTQHNAQNRGQLLGKLLRLDVSGAPPYAIPPDNPFIGTPGARGEVWAYGLRNPFRFSFDSLVPDLYVGDVGQTAWEEVDRQPADSSGGENYGWSCREGAHPYVDATPDPLCAPPLAPYVEPILEFAHLQAPPDAQWRCVVTGGYRYRGRDAAELTDAYVYGDYCSGEIWAAVPAADGSWSANLVLDLPRGESFSNYAQLTSFGEDEAGELYLLQTESAAGCVEPCGVLARLTGTPSGRLFVDGFEWRRVDRWSSATN